MKCEIDKATGLSKGKWKISKCKRRALYIIDVKGQERASCKQHSSLGRIVRTI